MCQYKRGWARLERTHGSEHRAAATPRVIGRTAHGIVETLSGNQSVVIFAPLGYGKSVLFESIALTLRALGREPLNIAVNPLVHSVPCGSIRSQLGLAMSPTDGEFSTATLLSSAQAQTGSSHPVIMVDDAHLLDPQSMDGLYQLAAARSIVLLVTSDLVPAIDTPTTDAATIRLLDELWIRGGAERIDLEPLSPVQSGQLVREFAPTTRFDRVTLAFLHSRSGGSRLLLRELTSEAVRQQPLPDDRDRTAFALHTPSQRILDLLAHQLRGLTATQLVTLALIGSLTGISTGRASMICDAGELRDLIRRGYVYPGAERSGQLQARTLLADVALTLCDAEQLRTQQALIVSILLTDRHYGFTTTPAECVTIADSWTASGNLPPSVVDEWGSSVVADVLLVAARRSRSLGLTEKALLYSAITLRLEPGLKATIEYSRALASGERYSAALAVLANTEELLHTPADGVKLARWHMSLAKFTTMTADDFTALRTQAASWFPTSTMMHGEVDFVRLTQSVQDVDWPRVAVDGESIARNEDCDVITRIRAACLSGIGHAYDGRTAQGLGMFDLATTLNQRDLAQRDADIYSGEGLALEIFYSSAAVRCLSGFGVQVVADELDEWISRSIINHDLGNLGFLGFVAAELSQFRGDVAGTEADLRAADAHFARSDPDAWRTWIQCLHASSLARMGLMDAARAKIAKIRVLPEEMTALYQFEATRSTLKGLLTAGSTDGARLVASQLYESAEAQTPVMRAWLLDVLVGLGEPPNDLVHILDRAVATNDAPIVAALAQRTRAVAAQDAAALDLAAGQLADLGAYGIAMTASNEAAAMHELHGQSDSADLSRLRADGFSLASRQLPVNVPASLLIEPVLLTYPVLLTEREREVTSLATQGLSNRDIAKSLFLSVRTVESHLYQARIKTGQNSRGDLTSV